MVWAISVGFWGLSHVVSAVLILTNKVSILLKVLVTLQSMKVKLASS